MWINALNLVVVLSVGLLFTLPLQDGLKFILLVLCIHSLIVSLVVPGCRYTRLVNVAAIISAQAAICGLYIFAIA